MTSDWLDILRSRLPGTAGGPAGGPRGRRDTRDASASGCPGGVRPAGGRHAGIRHLLKGVGVALAALTLLTAPTPAFSTVQGDHIVNNAQLISNGTTLASTSVTVTVVVRTPSTIEFLKYAPQLAGATPVNVAPCAYRTGSDPSAPFAGMPPPIPAGFTTPIDLSKPVPLATATAYHGGEPVFVRVTDPDQNLDRTRADTIMVTITADKTGDVEVLRLTETGPDTGVFVGYIQSTENATSGPYSGSLPVDSGSTIKASYTDIFDGTDSVTSAAVVDPFGIVFSSATGKPVDGVAITLIDTATGKPATVLGDDGVSAFPPTVASGGTATDASGRRYDFPPGGFRFPFVNPGTYRLQVVPPPGYASPSSVSDATLQKLPGGPFALVNPGSRGEPFTINPGPAMHVDVPMDPADTVLWLQKTAGKDIVAAGDFLPYQLDMQNTDAAATAPGVIMTDTLPLGFRYQKGSTKLNGAVAPDPAVSADGRTLTFTVGDLAAKATASIRYVVEVAAGARLGIATNQATARSATGMISNLATATVQVRSDFLNSRSIIMGEVIAGACGAPHGDKLAGVAGVRIFLEDGTFVDTDKQGMFHFEGVRPGSHVVQLDLDSLPNNYRVVPCEENSRFAGSAYSQFVDVQGGTLWRADFHVAVKAERKSEEEIRKEAEELARLEAAKKAKEAASLELSGTLEGASADYQLIVWGSAKPMKNVHLTVTLPDGAAYEKGSSQLGDEPAADPEVNDGTLSWKLDDFPGDTSRNVRFRTTFDPQGKAGELPLRATLTYDSPTEKGIVAPVAERAVARRITEEGRSTGPKIVLHPGFETFSAELGPEDRQVLDELANRLKGLEITQIIATGHTDNVRIAPRSRGIYPDNQALSLARGKSVGRYLMTALHFPPSKLTVRGMGETQPVATNRTKRGRAQNRRVDLEIETESVTEKPRLEAIAAAPVPETKSESPPAAASATADPPAANGAEPSPAKPGGAAEQGVKEKEGILSPRKETILAQRIHAVRVCLPVDLTPALYLDGKEIPAERIGFTMKDERSGKMLLTYIGVDFGDKGEHLMRLQGTDPFGNVRFEDKVTVVRSGDIAGIRLVDAEGNVADGKTPVRMRLQLLDANGNVIPADADLEIRSGTLKPLKVNSALPDTTASSGLEKVHVNQAGEVLFQPVNNSGPYRAVLGYNKATLEAETYVKPLLRDWILVGLGEGTVGYNVVSGNMEGLSGSDQDEHFYENGRLAFYAKGKVKGEWLLTIAYDSAKGKGDTGNSSLFQTIDPNTYYTLYGDAGRQQYDAASARKLYLKIERDQFYALFGDFDTGLTVTELSRYSRRLNGLKAEWQGKNFEANVFGTDTAQAYARDEIRGDGTSGLYHLSRKNIVINSDKITIETRDRFHSEIIINSTSMGRFTDYSIDYDSGTIFFKQPIWSRDDNFNPIYIVTEYETLDTGTEALTYGGRVGAKLLDNKLKTGFTYIHEGQVSGEGNSYGLDTTYKIGTGTTLKAEVARTDTNFGGTTREGNAYLAELQHSSSKFQGKLYFREQDEGFGLGQQNGSETGTRKAGADAAYKLTEAVSLGGQAYRQYNLATGGVQDVVEGKTTYTTGPYGAHLGFRHASDRLGDGSVKTSEQLTMGGSWLTLNKRLNLHVDHDQSIGGNDNASFPTRTTFGADFKLTEKVALFAQQQITHGAGADTNTTSAGMKATPWEGGTVNTSMGQNLNENGERIFALFGLKQTWKITDKWSVDGGLDRSQTIKRPGNYQFNVNVPPASGDNRDFTAVSLGTTYKEQKWNWNSRLEVRTSDAEDKWGVVTAFVGEPKEGWGWSARCQVFDTRSADGTSKVSGDLRLGLAYRPLYTRWIILDRLDFLYDRQQGGTTATAGTTGTTVTSFNTDNRRIVNNLSANFKPDGKTQISLQYGAKYVLETIDGTDYSGYTDLVGVEGRYDLTKEWDVGLRGSVLHSWNANQLNYSAGPSVGYNVVKNAWISLGYNFVGFTDKDFSAADYTAQGPFVRFRFKFDQNSVREAVNWISHE